MAFTTSATTSFNILKQLQYSTGSDYGDNLNLAPSRIIPTNLVEDISEDIEEKNIIYYVPPRLGNEYVICEACKKLPEPSAYFRSPNTFLKSFLYLSNVSYYDNIHLPSKANSLLEKYLRDIFQKYSTSKKSLEVSRNKKLIQIILNNTESNFDTDPDKNPYFSKFIKIILNINDIIVIRADDNGNYYDTISNNVKDGKYVLLQHSNGLFSPYGTLLK